MNVSDISTPSRRASNYPSGEYVLATGAGAVRRLLLLHNIYSPAGRRVLLSAGLKPGMKAADFGCGIGAVTHMLAEMVGPRGMLVESMRTKANLNRPGTLVSKPA